MLRQNDRRPDGGRRLRDREKYHCISLHIREYLRSWYHRGEERDVLDVTVEEVIGTSATTGTNVKPTIRVKVWRKH